MLTINIIFCIVALTLMSGPLSVHTDCQPDMSSKSEMLTLICTNLTEDQFLSSSQKFENKTIDKLIIKHVNLTSLPAYSQWHEHIQQIKIEYHFEDINENFTRDFKKLHILNICKSSGNKYKGLYLNSDVTKTDLIFDNNNIEEIDFLCHGDYNFVWNLSLKQNKINSFAPNGDSNCKKKLRKLDLKYNKLTTFNFSVLRDLSELHWIDISNNNIESFNYVTLYDSNTNLKWLYLDVNSLSNLKNFPYQFLSNLETLSLSHNRLNSLPNYNNTFSLLTKLKILDISNNLIETLGPRIIYYLPSLEQLDIRGNLLERLKIHKFSSNSLRYISLSGNQWDCKDFTILIKYLFDNHINYSYSRELHIDDPNKPELFCMDTEIVSKEDKRFEQIYESQHFIVVLIGIVIGLIILLIIVALLIFIIVQIHRRCKKQNEVEVKSIDSRERPAINIEELHYDYVELADVKQQDEAIYEEPIDLVPQPTKRGL